MRRFLLASMALWATTVSASHAQIRLPIRMPSVRQLREQIRPPQAQSTVSPNFQPSAYDRIAVVVIDNSGRAHVGHHRQVEDAFMSAVIGKGYTLAARSDVDRVKNEIHFESTGATDEDITHLGTLLNVKALVVASIDTDETNTERDGRTTNYYTSTAISARLISVRTGEVMWVARHSGRTYGDQTRNSESNIVPSVASAVAATLPSRMMGGDLNSSTQARP